MRKILVVVVALASMNAFATRARVNALGNSPHLIDTQTVYSNPADMMMMGDFVTMESGTTTDTGSGKTAEGMVTRSMGDSKMALSLGHQSKNASATFGLRALSGITGVKSQQNPVELSYGMKSSDMAWGATLVYSNYNDKFATTKESSAGVRAGLRMGALDAKLALGLINSYETATQKFTGTTGVSGGVGYSMDNMYVFGNFEMAGFKVEPIPTAAETKKYDAQTISVGAMTSHKKDGNEFFYGVSLDNGTSKETVADTKTTTMTLPIWMGLEVDAASWLTLRGSIKQTTFINSSKTEVGPTPGPASTTETAPGVNTTAASVGAGLKWNKLTLDGALTGLTTSTGGAQTLDGNTLLGQVGVTYMF